MYGVLTVNYLYDLHYTGHTEYTELFPGPKFDEVTNDNLIVNVQNCRVNRVACLIKLRTLSS